MRERCVISTLLTIMCGSTDHYASERRNIYSPSPILHGESGRLEVLIGSWTQHLNTTCLFATRAVGEPAPRRGRGAFGAWQRCDAEGRMRRMLTRGPAPGCSSRHQNGIGLSRNVTGWRGLPWCIAASSTGSRRRWKCACEGLPAALTKLFGGAAPSAVVWGPNSAGGRWAD